MINLFFKLKYVKVRLQFYVKNVFIQLTVKCFYAKKQYINDKNWNIHILSINVN